MRRFFLDAPLAENITITGKDAHHISRVLRYESGTDIFVVGKEGQVGRARITVIGPDAVTAVLQEIIGERHEPPVDVWLAQGLPKGDKMEYIVQKAVEIGAVGVIPMAIDFCTVQYDAAKKKSRVQRWQKIAEEAAKQCGRDLVPAISPVQSLAEVLDGAQPDTAVIMLYEGKTGEGLKDILTKCSANTYLLLIGTEGGFSPAEASLCEQRGVYVATMGPRILRTETAALAALSITMYEKGDLG